VGCKQTDCASYSNAHYSYEGYCVCGSSGSINENPADPNKECGRPSTDPACPGCLYACVHLDEECPAAPGAESEVEDAPAVTVTTTMSAAVTPGVVTQDLAPGDIGSGPLNLAALSADVAPPTCEEFCGRLFGGKKGTTVLEATGTYPACRCQADVKDDLGRLRQTIILDGDNRTTSTFDPVSGELRSRETVSLEKERAAIRERLGFKYDEETIDRLLAPERITTWFSSRVEDIETRTSWLNPYFWWQHGVALLDHGFGNDADFVETYHYGRCGDSMLWLEQELSAELAFTDEEGKKTEAMLSITGEKLWNTFNHTALIIRPQGIGNEEWAEAVGRLTDQSRGEDGLSEGRIKDIDPRLLEATVLDPYFRKTTTVKDFIKGWSVIRVS
jgi:hypothetical protein